MNSSHPADDEPRSSRIPKGSIVLILIILGSMALLAVYTNIQHFRRDQVETVIMTPANSSSAPRP